MAEIFRVFRQFHIDVYADADNCVFGALCRHLAFQQDAADLFAINQDVIRPLELTSQSCRFFNAIQDSQRG